MVRYLAGGCIRGRQLAVRSCPDAADAATSADEQSGRSEAYEGKKQRVLDQVLTLFVVNEVVE